MSKTTAILVDTPDGKKGKVYYTDLHFNPMPTYIVDETFQETGEKKLYSGMDLIVAGRID